METINVDITKHADGCATNKAHAKTWYDFVGGGVCPICKAVPEFKPKQIKKVTVSDNGPLVRGLSSGERIN